MQEEELVFLPGYVLREKVLNKELSCKEITSTFLNRIERLDPKINSYILVLKDLAIKQAEEIDNNLELYRDRALLGIPISIKDLLFDIENTVTTNGSVACMLRKASKDSLAVKRLREAQSIFLGKTNVPEFGSGYITKNRLMKPTANPWSLSYSTGGSSGGSAASVSAGLAAIAIANDSAGSIRLPSSFCSLFGYMPSYGRVPLTEKDEFAFKPLLRNGPITRTVKDAAILLDVISKDCELDPDQKPQMSFTSLLNQKFKPVKIAWSPDLGIGIQNDEIIEVIQKKLIELQKLGFEVEEVKFPMDITGHLDDLKNFIFAKFETLDQKIPFLVRPILSSSINHILEQASKVTPKDYEKARKFREEFCQQMNAFMQKYPLLLTPTAASASFPIEEFPECIQKIHSDPFVFFASFLFPFNFSGQPAASLPCGFTKKGLPIGLQVIGPENNDSVIFSFCKYFEEVFPWHSYHPKL